MRENVRALLILPFLGLALGSASILLIKSTRSVELTLISALALSALGLSAVTLWLLFRKINEVDMRQKHLENLQTEWRATQDFVRQLLNHRDQLGLLVQLLHQFVLATKRQDILLSLLRELPPFLQLSEMEAVIFNGVTLHGMYDSSSERVEVRELADQEKEQLPAWAKGQLPRTTTHTPNSALIPVIIGEVVIALLRLSRSLDKPFTVDELRFLEAVANQTALALERVKLIAFWENLSITDSLTGIANRRHFEWRLSEEIERARRYKYPLSILMLDLDHFKEVNDNYGHQVGDIVLQQVAQRLKQTLRRTDFLARYGGEEFVVLAPQVPADKSLLLAERLRRTISDSPFAVLDNLQLNITVSIGVAVFPDHAQNESELISAADTALYRAKQAGRNKVCLFEPEIQKGGKEDVRA